MNELDPVVAALIGAVVGGVITWLTSEYTTRLITDSTHQHALWSRTIDIHQEFNTLGLSQSRSKAAIFIRKDFGKSFSHISAEDENIEAIPLWDVMHFYQRLHMLVCNKQLIDKQVPVLFGEVFSWWYIVVFRQQVENKEWKDKWDAIKDIEKLYIWMSQQTPTAQWDGWTNRHESNYEEFKSKYSEKKQIILLTKV